MLHLSNHSFHMQPRCSRFDLNSHLLRLRPVPHQQRLRLQQPVALVVVVVVVVLLLLMWLGTPSLPAQHSTQAAVKQLHMHQAARLC
jgi:hypothetical protein